MPEPLVKAKWDNTGNLCHHLCSHLDFWNRALCALREQARIKKLSTHLIRKNRINKLSCQQQTLLCSSLLIKDNACYFSQRLFCCLTAVKTQMSIQIDFFYILSAYIYGTTVSIDLASVFTLWLSEKQPGCALHALCIILLLFCDCICTSHCSLWGCFGWLSYLHALIIHTHTHTSIVRYISSGDTNA